MNARNASRELRRATARRNHLANKIAESLSSAPGAYPLALVREWEVATMRVYALENNLRPRECGAPLGEGNNQAATARRSSRPVDRAPDAAPNPAFLPNTNPNPTMNEIPDPNPCDGCPVRYQCHKKDADCLMPERWEEARDE